LDHEKLAEQLETERATSPKIRVTHGLQRKFIATKAARNIGLALVMLIVVYLCFAITIVRFVPTSFGLVLTKNNTYAGNILPSNSQVLINPGVTVKTNILGRLKESFIPTSHAQLLEVLAGPTGTINWTKPNILAVNGQVLTAKFPQNPGIKYLNNQYIGVCLKGYCTVGQPVIFDASNVLGIPENKVSTAGVN
jgi:hypothetical protein